jgi:hypothetical protein
MARSKRANADGNIWLRQPGESEKAFAAFNCYLELGDGRTISAVGQKQGKSRSQIDGWRGKFEWKERAAAYDNYLMSEKAKKTRRDVESRYERFGKISDQLLAFGATMLKTADPKTLKHGEAIAYMQLAMKMADANKNALTPAEESESARKLSEGFLEAFGMFVEDGDE